jgi:hypothetical protein
MTRVEAFLDLLNARREASPRALEHPFAWGIK